MSKMITISDSCVCGARFALVSDHVAVRHDAWLEAHAVCRESRRIPEALSSQDGLEGDRGPLLKERHDHK